MRKRKSPPASIYTLPASGLGKTGPDFEKWWTEIRAPGYEFGISRDEIETARMAAMAGWAAALALVAAQPTPESREGRGEAALIALHDTVAALRRIRMRISEFDAHDQAALAVGMAALAGHDVGESLAAILNAVRVNGRMGHYLNDLCTHLPAEIHGQPCGHYAADLFEKFESEVRALAKTQGGSHG